VRAPARVGWFLLLPVLLVLVFKVFVADVYRVDSGSMEPTIHGAVEDGELVLVRYAHDPELERFDLAVLLRDGEREPIVKRVVGLPGEEVLIRDGDLVIDGAKLGPRSPRPAPVPIFDSGLHAMEEHFEFTGDWDPPGDAALAASWAPAQACWRFGVHDDHLDPEGRRVPGRNPVGDLILECALRFPTPGSPADPGRRDPVAGGLLALSLSEEGDLFELRLEPRPDGPVELSLVRRGPGSGEARLGYVETRFDADRETLVRFSNIDDVLAAEIDGRRLLEVPYASNTPLVGAPDPRLRHRRPRVCVTAVRVAVRIGRLRILRDLHYTEFGDIGVLGPVNLGEDEYFCLGDHSGESVDGRTFGPVAGSEVLGIPLAVVWPPRRARLLRPLPASPAQGPGN